MKGRLMRRGRRRNRRLRRREVMKAMLKLSCMEELPVRMQALMLRRL